MSVRPRCRDAVAGWARAANGAGNRWAAIAAAVRWPEPRWPEPVVGGRSRCLK